MDGGILLAIIVVVLSMAMSLVNKVLKKAGEINIPGPGQSDPDASPAAPEPTLVSSPSPAASPSPVTSPSPALSSAAVSSAGESPASSSAAELSAGGPQAFPSAPLSALPSARSSVHNVSSRTPALAKSQREPSQEPQTPRKFILDKRNLIIYSEIMTPKYLK